MELYILDTCYNPTAAANNRLFSYASAWKKHGIKTTFSICSSTVKV